MSEKKVNREICSKKITLINKDEVFVGVVDKDFAINEAIKCGLDLVQISGDDVESPICKILDFGKYKYQQSKKDKKNHNNSVVIKEIRIGHNIAEHDLLTKNNMVNSFLDKKYKVKYVLKLKGCPFVHQEKAKIKFREILQTFIEKADVGKEEVGDKIVTVMLAPKQKEN